MTESKKDSTIYKNNPMISETTISIQSINLVNCSLKKNQTKYLVSRVKQTCMYTEYIVFCIPFTSQFMEVDCSSAAGISQF